MIVPHMFRSLVVTCDQKPSIELVFSMLTFYLLYSQSTVCAVCMVDNSQQYVYNVFITIDKPIYASMSAPHGSCGHKGL